MKGKNIIMKVRYFMLPLIILVLISLILKDEELVTNKNYIQDGKEINYPFFSNEAIDNYISTYLKSGLEEEKEVIIDYDYIDIDNLYYLTFYKHIIESNIVESTKDNFIINPTENKIEKVQNISYEFNPIKSKIIDTSQKLIALTFDDGPNYNSNKVLDILNKYNINATFFVLGSRIKGNEDILKRVYQSGSEIGNHTYNHLLLTKYKEDKIKEEIENTSNQIYNVIGTYPILLRPSYGSFNKKIKKLSNYPIIIWDIDTLDWKYHNSKRIANRILTKVKDGDIILMHDIYSATANALNIIIPELQKRGYTFVTVSELFYYKNTPLERGKVYGSA